MHHCIHTVGPKLGHGKYTDAEAVWKLAGAYRNVLSQFVRFAESKAAAGPAPTGTPVRLRLLPISGGIFAGAFRERVPRLTREALDAGFAQLPEATQQRLLSRERTLELCIFAEAEFEGFVRVGFHPDAGYAEANS